MTPFSHRINSLLLLCIFAPFFGVTPGSASGRGAETQPQLTDSLYNAHHPRLLFTTAEIPSLFQKVRDNGNDDDAYALIRHAAEQIYPGLSIEDLLESDYGLNTIPNLGLAGYLETPKDPAPLAIGRDITLYIADSCDVERDDFGSSLRLRSLALGYDMFFENSSESERDYVRNEITSYIDHMTTDKNYEVWLYRPYLGNRSMMIASSLGMAAICLEEETDPARIMAALDFADEIITAWLTHQLDENGAYNEGLVYGGWSMRMLIYYSHARKRYDGYDYSTINRIRNMEKWFAYELLPEGSGRTNNLNDCAYEDYILSRHHTYFDWAQTEWGSSLSSWIWDHTAGDEGWDWELEADNAATVIWNQTLPPVQPESVLPKSLFWDHRGLYYYRSGWQMGPSSKDVLFSFYAGVFQGAHAQEDQGQFTLCGYGAKFAIDHGPGVTAKQTEAHNIVLIDDLGQHNAGLSIGTDGVMREFLLTDFADYLSSDLTRAYTTYSRWNWRNVPFMGQDWSWGYDGGNPVNYAYRTVLVVHDSSLPPYFIIIDDIEKDGLSHEYDWRMHTHVTNSVDASTNPIRISKDTSRLDIHVIEPPFESLQPTVTPFDNKNDEPDAVVLSLSVTETSPEFDLLLFPADQSTTTPLVSKQAYSWGYTLTLNWGGGITDVFVRNTTGGTVKYPVSVPVVTDQPPNIRQEVTTAASNDSITTDAPLALVKLEGARLTKYLLVDASELTYKGTRYVSVLNGRVSCGLSGDVIHIDRYDADFTFYAPGADKVFYKNQQIHVVSQGGYLTRDPVTGVVEKPRPDFFVRATVQPNPFNPSTVVLVEIPEGADVEATIYDPNGRLVKKLWHDVLPRGISTLEWNGTNENGLLVASGVYFLRIQSRGSSETTKLVLLR
ncbi:MAG: T9SS type A sorting domain-containing protein [Candidatus Latescibacterota bacterium]|nr:MAG: T9SS type A sorting domain-containing protein [Candidatus Latescibacterota bacterium]